MSDFAKSWTLSRTRLIDEISSLSAAQLNWRIHPKCLSIGEMALHVAGVEVYFAAQLKGRQLAGLEARLAACATEGVVNDKPFPFTAAEIGPDSVREAFALGEAEVKPLIEAPTAEILSHELVSALGPLISGEGAFTRLGFHAAYHQGQAYLIKTAPGFPS